VKTRTAPADSALVSSAAPIDNPAAAVRSSTFGFASESTTARRNAFLGVAVLRESIHAGGGLGVPRCSHLRIPRRTRVMPIAIRPHEAQVGVPS
jgi:hypothetical protein